MCRFWESQGLRSTYKYKGDLMAPGLLPSKGEPQGL